MADGLADVFGPRTLRKRQAEEAQPAWAKGSIDRMLASMTAPVGEAPQVPNGDPQIGLPDQADPVYDTDPARQAEYLKQRALRGGSDAAFGGADLVNMLANALIKDADYFTGGGLSGGKYDPFQFGMPSQDAADLATAFTGAEIIPAESMPPDVRRQGDLARNMVGSIPTDPTDVASGFAKAAIIPGASKLLKSGRFDIVPDDPLQIVAKDAKGRRKDPELFHPVGGGVKMDVPFSELTSTTVPTGGTALPPQKSLNPEDLVGKVGLALLGDNTRAGETLTHVGDLQLPRAQPLHGGYRFMDEFEGSIWAAKEQAMRDIVERAQEEARRTGKEIVGLPVSMGTTGSNSARMMTRPALDLTNLEDMPPAVLEAFDNKMRALTTNARGVTRWPGLAAAKKDDVWLQTASGNDRATLVKVMSEGAFKDWFSHIPGLRKALSAPDLLNRPALTTGQAVGLFDQNGRLVSNPAKSHDTYGTQGAGTSLGRLGLLPYDAVFQRFARTRPPGEPSPHTMRTMMTQVPAQEFDNEWLDNFMRRIEREQGR